jgi:DNA-binding NtrC family response regulator
MTMLTGRRIALVEDDEIMGGSIAQRLRLEGAEVVWLKLTARALGAIRTPQALIDAVVCDIRLPDGTGEDLYATLCRHVTPPPFLFITGQGGIEQAVRLLRAGAADYVTKPFEMTVFLERLVMLLRPRKTMEMPPLQGISAAARRADALVQAAAGHDQPVLIRGPAGTGKARLAGRIHDLSDRRAAPFIELSLLRDANPSSALFDPKGALAQVGEGTLYLNGVGRLPMVAQDRLMAAIRGTPPFRLITSAGMRIGEKRVAGGFRADLFYLLAAHEIIIPALVERPEDAVWLLAHLFPALNAQREVPLTGISALTEAAVRAHDWPGNGREVRARLIRGLETATGKLLFPADLFPEHREHSGVLTLAEARDRAERAQIVAALERTGGQVAEAARLLQVSRTTLWEKMQKLGI